MVGNNEKIMKNKDVYIFYFTSANIYIFCHLKVQTNIKYITSMR